MTDQFYGEVIIERQRQDKKWGEQNHSPIEWLAILAEEFGSFAKAVNEAHWRPTEETAKKMQTELIHTAAVCKVIFEFGKRNGWL